jgi:hypothetical protein
MEGYCSTGQSPQPAVVPMEEKYLKIQFMTKEITMPLLPTSIN